MAYCCDTVVSFLLQWKYSIHFRGTKLFSIDMSNDGTKWTVALNSSLHSVAGRSCEDIKAERFDITFGGRYLRFNALDYYGAGAGLQSIAWRFDTESNSEFF